MLEAIEQKLRARQKALESISTSSIAEAAEVCLRAIARGNKVIFCGNGGSASQSQHLAAELVGRYERERSSLASISLTADTATLTAIANDYGYERIFARQLEGIGREGDVLIGLSTSGRSPNVIEAFKAARRMKIFTIAFVGHSACPLGEDADLCLAMPANETCIIQEMHLCAGHMLCGLIESMLSPHTRQPSKQERPHAQRRNLRSWTTPWQNHTSCTGRR